MDWVDLALQPGCTKKWFRVGECCSVHSQSLDHLLSVACLTLRHPMQHARTRRLTDSPVTDAPHLGDGRSKAAKGLTRARRP